MTYNMPLSKQNKSTKDAVISVLAEKWPLTAKEIYNRVKRESNTTVSYQAIHKLLNQLIEEKIIVKEGMGYLLNKDWIKNLKNFSSSLEELYLKNFGANALKELEEHGTINITVNGILETAKFIIGGLANLPNAGKKPNIFLWRNVYSVIGLAESDYAGIQKTFSENKWFAVASENNLLDRMFADTLEKYGVKNKLGVKEVATTLSDTVVVGDYVATVWYPPDFREGWLMQNRLPKSLTDFDLKEHLNKMRDIKAEINFVVVKNASLADQIRGQYLPMFDGGKK